MLEGTVDVIFDKPPDAQQSVSGDVPLLNDTASERKKSVHLNFFYYPFMRAIGYWFEANFSPFARWLTRKTLKGEPKYETNQKIMDYANAVYTEEFPEQAAVFYSGDEPLRRYSSAEIADLHEKSGLPKVDPATAGETKLQAKTAHDEIYEKHFDRAKLKVSRWETVAFLGWTFANLWSDRSNLNAELKPAVAAEIGKNTKDVTFMDMWSSKNPIVMQSMHRFAAQNIVRTGAGLSFLKSVNWGILGLAVNVTYERLLHRLVLDNLRDKVGSVQGNYLGDEAKPGVIESLKIAVQRSRNYLKLKALGKEDMRKLNPLLGRIADAIIERKIDFSGVVYLIGNIARTPDLRMMSQDIDSVINLGLTGIAAIEKDMRLNHAKYQVTEVSSPAGEKDNSTTVLSENGAAASSSIQKIVRKGGQAITPERIKDLAAAPAAAVRV